MALGELPSQLRWLSTARVSSGLIPACLSAAFTAVTVERRRITSWIISVSRMLEGRAEIAFASATRARRLPFLTAPCFAQSRGPSVASVALAARRRNPGSSQPTARRRLPRRVQRRVEERVRSKATVDCRGQNQIHGLPSQLRDV